jgi:O-antigen/teichoic acid export membrane protein
VERDKPDTVASEEGVAAIRSARGFALTTVTFALVRLISLIVTVGITRLLDAGELGRLVTTMIVFDLILVVGSAGLLTPLVVSKADLQEILGTGIVVCFAGGIVLAVLVYIGAFPLARLLGDQSVAELISPMAITIVLFLGAIPPRAILQRNLRFGSAAISELIPAVCYGGISLALIAFAGWDIRAVVAGMIARHALGLIMSWALVPWPGVPIFKARVMRKVVSFAGTSSATSVVQYLGLHLDNLFVVRWLGTVALGQYAAAFAVAMAPAAQIGDALGRILLPNFASVEGDRAVLRRRAALGFGAVTLTIFPLLGFLAGAASIVMTTVLGEAWRASALPMAALTVAAAGRSISAVTGNVLYALDRPRAVLGIGIATRVLQFAALIVVVIILGGDIVGVATAMSVVAIASLVPMFLALRRDLDIGFRAAALRLLRWSLPALTVFAVTLGISLLGFSGMRTLALQCILAFPILVISARLAHGREMFATYLRFLRSAMRSTRDTDGANAE